MSGPVEQYDQYRNSNKFVFVVFYRGSWCPFCQAYLKELEGLTSSITAAGGKVFAVTAEAATELPKMRKASGYQGDTIVDPENLLVAELKRRGVIEVAITERKGYPHGMAQPAVLVGGDAVGGILYKWAIVPAMMNLGGAKDRPSLSQVWENVDAQIQSKPKPHEKIRSQPFLSGIKQRLFG